MTAFTCSATGQTRATIYQALDVFALSSLREGLPNVVLEAMALEVPVAATRIAGVPRLIRDGENGLLVEPGSVDELVAALGRLLGDPELRRRLAHGRPPDHHGEAQLRRADAKDRRRL